MRHCASMLRLSTVADFSRAFRLLSLPRELRDRIYYNLGRDQDIHIILLNDYRRIEKLQGRALGSPMFGDITAIRAQNDVTYIKHILLVSHEVSQEAKEAIYKRSTFRFTDRGAVRTFVDRVPEPSLTMVGHLQLHWEIPTWAQSLWSYCVVASYILPKMPNLVCLDIQIILAATDTTAKGTPDIKIKEELYSSDTLHLLKCATLECKVYKSRGGMLIAERAQADFDKLKALVAGKLR